ncbi:peptide chain release factor N(5)-glutamine methyltransferase [Steroidobacter sp. S1-65]|uniref:Release factor glutamine methyltransferase n=1 Tax=Steroidobacter gossypii TaxID=2805490 RepID=A0ABS1WQA4_9GAMM|nr:peptide chain release factor N(5)-glutamine methyltransferase [Steroidobacter gossypii]MBM0103159.1 peptide chain release factor N(5)-glutamine methyltransferase [Steroidobacter gossypii]
MPAVKSSQTVSDALHTATLLLSRSSPSARLDAELLLEYVTGLSRTNFRANPERELPAAAGWSFQQLVKRRSQGEPVAYIRQQQEFWSLLLEVSPAVLIPRPETELVVERVLAHINKEDTVRVADLGTGSGAIAVALASERPSATVFASDASKDALELASRNIGRLQLTNVSLLHGSWWAPFEGMRLHAIASNPPYIAQDDPDLAPDVKRFEPGMALISGRTGFEAIDVIIRDAPTHLETGGWLVLEHGWKQAEAVRQRLVRGGFVHVRSHADLAGHERVTEGQWPEVRD